jgi:hypothetical protein
MWWLIGRNSETNLGKTVVGVCPYCNEETQCQEIIKSSQTSVWFLPVTDSDNICGYVCSRCGNKFENFKLRPNEKIVFVSFINVMVITLIFMIALFSIFGFSFWILLGVPASGFIVWFMWLVSRFNSAEVNVKKHPDNIRKDVTYKNEEEVESRLAEILRQRDNITFLFTSSQNIDRLVSAYKACLRTDSIFVIDLYTAYILDRLKEVSENIPQYNWKNIRIKFIHSHAKRLHEAGHKDLLYRYNKRKIELVEINEKKHRILMLARDNSVFPIIADKIDNIAGAKVIYSMWDGYLTDEFRAFCRQKGMDIENVHASGHASIKDLQAFAEALNPDALIPIHTFEAGLYPALFRNVKFIEDKEISEI